MTTNQTNNLRPVLGQIFIEENSEHNILFDKFIFRQKKQESFREH